MLKTEAIGGGFQHLPRDLANVNVLENIAGLLLLHKFKDLFVKIWETMWHYILSPFGRQGASAHFLNAILQFLEAEILQHVSFTIVLLSV